MTLSAHGYAIASRGLSVDQLAKIDAFKRLLRQAGAWDDARFDEHDCARFLKARNWDVQAAKQMWDGMLMWRREHRVDTIHEWFDFHERPEYDRVFPTGLHKTDKEGHPILIQQLGRVNIGALYKVTNDDRIRMAHIAENENLRRTVFPACSRAAGRPVDQLFTIIDLEGVAFTSMMRTTSLLKMFMAMDSNNYPETLAHMAIINAPGWFSTSWSAVKSVLSGDTVRKIQILGKDYQSALLRHIPRENLLAEYGGTSSGRVTDNIGPWQEPLLPLPMELMPEPPAPPPEAAITELDVPLRRPPSPVRPGALGGHPAPPASPPCAKRLHTLEPLVPEPQLLAGRSPQAGQPRGGAGGSTEHSDAGSDATAHSMAAPLLSNFMPASDSPLHERPLSQPLLVEVPTAPEATSGQQMPAPPALPSPKAQHAAASAKGLVGGLAAGLVAGIQAAASHVGYHAHPSPPSMTAAQGPVDGGVLHPPPDPSGAAQLGSPTAQGITLQPHPRVSAFQTPLPQPQLQQYQSATPTLTTRAPAAGMPTQLQLASPREDGMGTTTYISSTSMAYSPLSAFSPMSQLDPHAAADTATSRPVEVRAEATGVVSGRSAGLGRLSGGGVGMGSGTVGPGTGAGGFSGFTSGLFGSASLATTSAELPHAAPGQALQHQQTSQQDMDDAESVRMSVMSQRSFYSALSHVEYSSSSGLTSPNEASERARRWSLQRELHAAAIASALAATAEQRRAAAAAGLTVVSPAPSITARSAGSGAAATGGGRQSGGGAPPAPTAASLPGVPSFLPPAAQQAFGSYLDQPPPYGAARSAAAGTPSDGAGLPAAGAAAGDRDHAGSGERGGHSRSASHVEVASLAGDAVLNVDSDGGGGLSRSDSAAALDECNLGAGAVRWARGWFFRRRNYGRLVESDPASNIRMGSRGGGGEGGKNGMPGMNGRKASAGGPYSSVMDGPDGTCATSPSKTLPKGGLHHARGDSWDWDQPSPYDHDQTSRGPGALREAPFGRGGERRRLLRADSPGHRRGFLDGCCSCLPCCTIM